MWRERERCVQVSEVTPGVILQKLHILSTVDL